MTNENKNLLKIALEAFQKRTMDPKDHFAFSRDHRRWENQELTFRELIEAIRTPNGALKEAMNRHYADSAYKRHFK